MNICIFGGAFDPIHRGHLAVARAAAARFKLDVVWFVPSHTPPHKLNQPMAPFADRYAMVALATSAVKKFVPSDIEFQRQGRNSRPSYSIDTVRAFRRGMQKSDSLFFLAGMDAFLTLSTWRQPIDLLQEAQLIVATRPGYRLRRKPGGPRDLPAATEFSAAIRERVRFITVAPLNSPPRKQSGGEIAVRLLDTVHDLNSATEIREAVARGRDLVKFVPPAVAVYIAKKGLYQSI